MMVSEEEREFVKRHFGVDIGEKTDTINLMGIEISKSEYENMLSNHPEGNLSEEEKLEKNQRYIKKNIFMIRDD